MHDVSYKIELEEAGIFKTEAYFEGRNAFRDGKAFHDNPHIEKSGMSSLYWDDGWLDKMAECPIGTIAPSINGGHWYYRGNSWKRNGPDGNGGHFPRPGGDWTGKLIPPKDAQQ